MATMTAVSEVVKQAALEAGFELAGVAAVRDFPELEYFPRWLASGYGGEMRYLEARDELGDLKRASLCSVAPWARSVVVCAKNYNTHAPYSIETAPQKPALDISDSGCKNANAATGLDLALRMEPGGLSRCCAATAPPGGSQAATGRRGGDRNPELC